MKDVTIIGLRLHVPSRVFVRQLFGNAVIALLFIAWLRIPDSHTWRFLFSVLVIAALAVAFLWLHTTTLRTLREPTSTAEARRFSYVLLAIWLAVWGLLSYFLLALFDPIKVSTRAGYWNSRQSAHMRHTFTYERLSNWQHGLLEIVLWWVLPTLLLPLIIESVARAVRTLRERATYCVYRRPLLWLGTLIASLAAYWLTIALLTWHPGHSVHAELISLVLRVGMVYAIDVTIYVLLVAAIAQSLAREHALGDSTP